MVDKVTPAEIAEAKRHTVHVVTTYVAGGTRHTLRYVKRFPYETIVGPFFKSESAARKFAKAHGITIS